MLLPTLALHSPPPPPPFLACFQHPLFKSVLPVQLGPVKARLKELCQESLICKGGDETELRGKTGGRSVWGIL